MYSEAKSAVIGSDASRPQPPALSIFRSGPLHQISHPFDGHKALARSRIG